MASPENLLTEFPNFCIKTYELLISGIVHLMFSDYIWLRVTKIMGCETMDKEDYYIQ